MVIKKNKKKKVSKLGTKYKVSILNIETWEEKFSIKLSPLNIILLTGLLIILSMSAGFALVYYTSLKRYIPGYPTVDYKKELVKLNMAIDSLESSIEEKNLYLLQLKRILLGEVDSFGFYVSVDTMVNRQISLSDLMPTDTGFRNFVETEEKYSVLFSPVIKKDEINFFAPLKGMISNGFDTRNLHFGVDIPSKENVMINAVYDGKVIFGEWTIENGYVLLIQHKDNWVSVYMHCGALLKKKGDEVRTGEPVALVGNKGENTSGPHLHFELWHNGNPVDPASYIIFE